MRIRICLLLILPWQFAFSQIEYMPYELERFEQIVYVDELSSRNTYFAGELEALEFYFLSYKAQRSTQPENYFPEPNENRIKAASYLRENFAFGDVTTFINFLENNGNMASCKALIAGTSNLKILLPYKFLSSYILESQEKQQDYLNKMSANGMISNVLSSFGENALNSFSSSQIVITQGLQDLIAIEYALSQTSTRIKTLNLFAETCKGYTGIKSNSALDVSQNQIWISPAVSSSLIKHYQNNILISGIGFVIPLANETHAEELTGIMNNVGRNFAGIGMAAKNPAEKGIISSYLYFAKAYRMLAYTNCEQIDIKDSEAIYKYIEKAIK